MDHFIRRLEEWICSSALVVVVTLVTVQVFFRYVLSSGILWIDEIVTNLMVLMVMFGAALATRNDVHTKLLMFTEGTRPWLRFVLRAVINITVLGFLGLFIASSAIHAFNSKGLSTTVTHMPLWLVYGQLVIGGLLILYEFINSLRRPPTLDAVAGA